MGGSVHTNKTQVMANVRTYICKGKFVSVLN
jgi:hypothetical protein